MRDHTMWRALCLLLVCGCTGNITDGRGGADDGDADASGGDDEGGDVDGGASVDECAAPAAEWIFCDDFELDRLDSYFEVDDAGGDFARTPGAGVGDSVGMRGVYPTSEQTSAGSLKLAFGLQPPLGYFAPVDAGTAKRREIYWRLYLRHPDSWVGGGPDKLSRATIMAGTSWQQAMIAHVWSGPGDTLALDPASGTDTSGDLQTTTYNDFANLRWLGLDTSETPIFADAYVGRWYCIEAHVRLNDAGVANGTFTLWIDDVLEAERTGLNWVGDYEAYGINQIYFENFWNDGAPVAEERSFDNIVVSSSRIGCLPTD